MKILLSDNAYIICLVVLIIIAAVLFAGEPDLHDVLIKKLLK